MPSDFMALDMGYPNLKGLDTEKKLQTMEDYLMQLLEQLRYTLHNLSTGNFNRAALEAFASSISTPVSIALKKEIDRAEGAEGQLRTDIGIVAGEVRSEVTRATGAETEIRSEIVQTADDVMLRVVGGYANEWTDGRRYYESDAVKVTTVTDGKVTAVAFYKAKQEHTAAAANKPPSAAYWDIVASPSVQSIIDLNLDGITLEYDNSGVSDKNAAFIKLSKDGVQIAGRKVIMTNVEADTLTANAVNAIRLDASQINAGTLSADRIGANSIHLGKLGSDVTSSFGEDNPGYIQPTYIDETEIRSPTIKAGDFYGAAYHDYDANGNSYLTFDIVPDGNRGGGIILSSDVANVVLFSVENVVQGSQGSWVLLSRINGAGDAACIETTYDQSTGKIGKYLVGRWTINDGLVLGPYSNHAGLYGSLAERNSISNPETGQVFFVI